MLLTVMSQNVCRSGSVDPQGRPEGRWTGMAGVIRQVGADVVLLQEAGGFRRLKDEEKELPGLPGLGWEIAPSPVGGNIVAWRPDRLELVNWETHLSHRTMYGFGVATFRIPGLDPLISFSSVHLNPYDASAAAGEAKIILARLFRNGGLGLLGGDVNHLPANPVLDPDPDWAAVPPYNRSARTLAGSRYLGDRIVGNTLTQGGLVDIAAHLAAAEGDPSLCGPTATAGGIRVDQFWGTPALAPAAKAYRRINPEGHSDHFGIVAGFDLTAIDRSRLAEFV